MLDNLGKIAVIITGEYRTWAVSKKYIFNFFNSSNVEVDYFFVTWDTIGYNNKTVDIEEIYTSFTGKKLIQAWVEKSPLDKNNTINFLLKAHLSKIANIFKRRYELENNFVYDNVIEIRPDLYLGATTDNAKHCNDFEIVVSEWWVSDECPFPMIADLYFRTTSIGHDIISTRNQYGKFKQLNNFTDLIRKNYEYLPMLSTQDPHFMLSDFLLHRRMILTPTVKNEVSAVVIRPTVPEDDTYYSYDQIVKFDLDYRR